MTAVKQYNNIMNDICREHLTIGTRLSEGTENWNLRDMVSEMQYTLNIYEDPDCVYYQDAHYGLENHEPEWYEEYINTKARMKRFINKWKDEAMTMECTEGHCSDFD